MIMGTFPSVVVITLVHDVISSWIGKEVCEEAGISHRLFCAWLGMHSPSNVVDLVAAYVEDC